MWIIQYFLSLLDSNHICIVPELHGLDPNRDANNDYTDFVNTRV